MSFWLQIILRIFRRTGTFHFYAIRTFEIKSNWHCHEFDAITWLLNVVKRHTSVNQSKCNPSENEQMHNRCSRCCSTQTRQRWQLKIRAFNVFFIAIHECSSKHLKMHYRNGVWKISSSWKNSWKLMRKMIINLINHSR